MRRRFFKFYQNCRYFAPYWAPKGASPLFEQIGIPIPQACFPPILVHIGQVVHEKKIFKGFCYISLYKTISLRVWPFMTPGTSFEQN